MSISRVAVLALALASTHATPVLGPILGPILDTIPPIQIGPVTLLPDAVCAHIAKQLSYSSEVYYAPHPQYLSGLNHWASSSSQLSACVVEPGSAADIGIIFGVLNATRTPFAVKGGGHATNPGFSSTTGVHISMARFNNVLYDSTTDTATIGAGLLWDEVYATLEKYDVNVVGGRVTGVGVAGFTLGGGYSWKSNQYGLTVDTVVAYDLVTPLGVPVRVTEQSDPDLFFALRGGGNNFGIITQFVLKTFPQTLVWGGLITITGDQLDAVNAATAKFSAECFDPKASIITTYNSIGGQVGVAQLLFYDAPTPPPGIFDDFLAIPSFTSDVETRSFISLVQASPSDATSGTRGVFNTVPLTEISSAVLDVIVNETFYWGKHLLLNSAIFVSYDVEPFLPSAFTQDVSPSAYPPSRARALLPLNIYYAWVSALSDSVIYASIKASAATIEAKAVADGQDIVGAAKYGNYAVSGTPAEGVYGANTERLRAIRMRVDPGKVMNLAGGFRL